MIKHYGLHLIDVKRRHKVAQDDSDLQFTEMRKAAEEVKQRLSQSLQRTECIQEDLMTYAVRGDERIEVQRRELAQ